MGIADDLIAGPPSGQKPNLLRTWLDTLSDADREAAVTMLATPAWPLKKIFESFTRAGLITSLAYLERLRRTRAWV
jgi:hypothetical protein